jgi:hypothetical protein
MTHVGSGFAGLLLFASTALPCTCVVAINSTARTEMTYSAMVFRGTVVERRTLPPHAVGTRGRYAITFHVEEYWKGSPGRSVTLYGVDPGSDCLGDGGYEVSRSYLVYAGERGVEDGATVGRLFWTDIFPEGTKILMPDTACTPGGEASKVRKALRQLGRGRIPSGSD